MNFFIFNRRLDGCGSRKSKPRLGSRRRIQILDSCLMQVKDNWHLLRRRPREHYTPPSLVVISQKADLFVRISPRHVCSDVHHTGVQASKVGHSCYDTFGSDNTVRNSDTILHSCYDTLADDTIVRNSDTILYLSEKYQVDDTYRSR